MLLHYRINSIFYTPATITHTYIHTMHPSGNNRVHCPTKNVSPLSPGIKWKVGKKKRCGWILGYIELDIMFNANNTKDESL